MEIDGKEIDKKTLERLSNLDLEQYAGKPDAFQGEDSILVKKLMNSPVEIKVTAEPDICDKKLYDLCSNLQGTYDSFYSVRHKMTGITMQNDTFPKFPLTILFDGIYAGEPEDVSNYGKKIPAAILYPIEGLGKKIAEVRFLETANSK